MNVQHLHELTEAWRDGILSTPEAAELNGMLRESDEARGIFRREAELHGLLHAAVAAAVIEATSEKFTPQSSPSVPRRRDWFSWRPLAAAAALLALCGVMAVWWMQRGVDVEIIRATANSSSGWRAGDKVRTNQLTLVRGSMQMRLRSGVTMDVVAPVEMRFIDAMHVHVLTGRVTADVGEHGKGFVIETPQTRVVDLGTRFGVDASDAAHTDVVVFEGQVELYEKGVKEPMAMLNKGEGLRVGSHRRSSRIISVTGSDEAGSWTTQSRPAESAVIASVSDSMIESEEGAKKWPSLRNFYRIVPGGLGDGALAFSDEIDHWQAVPSSLAGADLVRTFAVDGFNWWMQMSVTVQRPCEVFVFVDTRNEVPEWLSREFANTGEKIILDRISRKQPDRVAQQLQFAVWKKTVTQPGEVKLGPPYPNPPADKKSFNPNRMFGVAAKALP